MQTPLQREQLVVDGQQRLRHRLRGDDVLVDEGVALAEKVEQGALGVEVGGAGVGADEVAFDAGFVHAVQLALEAVEVCFAEGPGLRQVHLFELVADFEQFVVGFLEALVDFALSVWGVSMWCGSSY